MGLSQALYQAVFKRNSIFVGTVFTGAFAFGLAFDTLATKLWDNHNAGKQWKDIRDKISSQAEE
ncbi:putative QCR9-ubiquinol--cytochrome-c reductase subunit 9 [Microstroma glucosiphilum]|uniref:Complex III subunit 9 n=1 Tax=Pseudomicrostroma glucosiphilum TaxID=1684307 RepID=A0A316ULU0_9BASI|nr:putative QCR9-ubiquinol--cytochrome-c reductase subunit 9 [Pseudomicrostroma glucosiphilum]PWN24165.1 putative QCR9-ubiquinol--cytochrome-c reductase subunit 9 [Pseudomicrostroma glucosiphilum]